MNLRYHICNFAFVVIVVLVAYLAYMSSVILYKGSPDHVAREIATKYANREDVALRRTVDQRDYIEFAGFRRGDKIIKITIKKKLGILGYGWQEETYESIR